MVLHFAKLRLGGLLCRLKNSLKVSRLREAPRLVYEQIVFVVYCKRKTQLTPPEFPPPGVTLL